MSATTGSGDGPAPTVSIRIAAAGDIHCDPAHRSRIEEAFSSLDGADMILLAGDLTNHGEPAEAEILAEICGQAGPPVFCVLGNHDCHAGREEEVKHALESGGAHVLDRGWHVCELGDLEVGIVGTKGFVGGFPGSHLPDFGERQLREVYAETTAEVEALDRGLREVAVCPVRIVLLHYSPTEETLVGEHQGIWAFLGSDRMGAPIREHEPTLVLHGHAHNGVLEGRIGPTPVLNVSVPVIGRDFWTVDLEADTVTTGTVH